MNNRAFLFDVNAVESNTPVAAPQSEADTLPYFRCSLRNYSLHPTNHCLPILPLSLPNSRQPRSPVGWSQTAASQRACPLKTRLTQTASMGSPEEHSQRQKAKKRHRIC
ncbi:hypothetical protein BLNAU_16236 [Blattamonas nauphoetae]|uniref:Uncharacterized protein n=1 Tax=Blattamonas nauphoetae TaxID=2049346 RepID=A0ABQ9X8I1_9EUKA|nr:hypothetical protein BLNAU_16236 [Blattamonas nauphoetae]